MNRNATKRDVGIADKRRFICFLLAICLGVASIGILCHASFADSTSIFSDKPFRLAFSNSMFVDVNEADVRAAMKVWIMTVAKDLSIPVDPDPNIQPTFEALAVEGASHSTEASPSGRKN